MIGYLVEHRLHSVALDADDEWADLDVGILFKTDSEARRYAKAAGVPSDEFNIVEYEELRVTGGWQRAKIDHRAEPAA